MTLASNGVFSRGQAEAARRGHIGTRNRVGRGRSEGTGRGDERRHHGRHCAQASGLDRRDEIRHGRGGHTWQFARRRDVYLRLYSLISNVK